ncbi:hypothetical protein AVEN_179860-1 [Araneus ventricosus]|uniref:Uncharacterized protein n=1 Tax=Araneus ventricosus TaxID=182803 RepID=A0A4Y2IH45_ARAVE|nr:hypothetical protein AVEN_179860-1 [Araneus ventricosus]
MLRSFGVTSPMFPVSENWDEETAVLETNKKSFSDELEGKRMIVSCLSSHRTECNEYPSQMTHGAARRKINRTLILSESVAVKNSPETVFLVLANQKLKVLSLSRNNHLLIKMATDLV